MAKRQDISSQLRFVSSKVACEVLGVTAQTLRRWAKKGQIGAIKTPGGQYRFDLSGLIVVPERPEPAPTVRKSRKVEAQVDLEEAIAKAPVHAPVKPLEVKPVMGPEALRAQVAKLASASVW